MLEPIRKIPTKPVGRAVAKWFRYLPLNLGVMGQAQHRVHNQDSSYDTSTGWFQDTDSKVISKILYIL